MLRPGRLIDGKLDTGNVGPGATTKVLLARDGAELLRPVGAGIPAEGALADGNGSGSRVGTGTTTGIGVNVGALMLALLERVWLGRENPNDGVTIEGMLEDGSTTVGSEMLRLGEGIVSEGMLKDGSLVVGSEMFRLGGGMVNDGIIRDGRAGVEIARDETVRDGSASDGTARDGAVTDGATTEGKPYDGASRLGVVLLLLTLGDGISKDVKLNGTALSTLFVGILKIGSAVGVAGKLIIGSPKELTMGGAVGIESILGNGMESGGGPVVAGSPIEGILTGGSDDSGTVTEGNWTPPWRLAYGTPIENPIPGGKVTGGTPVDGNESVPTLADGRASEGKVGEISDMVGSAAEGRVGVGTVTEGTLTEGGLSDGGVKDARPIEPELSDGRPSAEIVTDDKPIEFRLAEGTLSEGNVEPTGNAVANVAVGRTMVTSVLCGKLAAGRLPDGRLTDGRVAGSALNVGKLSDGRTIEFELIDGRPRGAGLPDAIESELGETEGRLIDAGVGTGAPTYSILTETSSGGLPRPVPALPPLLRACNTDMTDGVTLDGCPAGTVTGVVLATETVTEGTRMGLAEMMGARKKGKTVEKRMALGWR